MANRGSLAMAMAMAMAELVNAVDTFGSWSP
jgi:hypothetical protein